MPQVFSEVSIRVSYRYLQGTFQGTGGKLIVPLGLSYSLPRGPSLNRVGLELGRKLQKRKPSSMLHHKQLPAACPKIVHLLLIHTPYPHSNM